MADRLQHETSSGLRRHPPLHGQAKSQPPSQSEQTYRDDDQQAVRNQLLKMILRNEASRKLSRNEP